jgi:UDP-3-O-[3-hydroxymyristoyl] glucosamine N-acyltransferase
VDASAVEDAACGRDGDLLMAEITVRVIEELLGKEPSGDGRTFTRLSSYESAGGDAIVFAQDEASLGLALGSAAGLILAPLAAAGCGDVRVLAVRDPKYAFALCGRWLDGFTQVVVHESAVIDAGAVVGRGTSVGAGAVIEAGAIVGEDCVIGSHVTILGSATLGDRVVVQAGAVLGAMGFGYVRGEDGRYVRFPQQGRLYVEDDVEVGANTTIDRGALGETRVGRGTKIDNLVHVGHNCVIGKNVVIAAQTGISGSSVVEDGAILGGQVGIGEHATVGKGVILGGGAGVLSGKKMRGEGEVFWGRPARPLKEYLRDLARLKKR